MIYESYPWKRDLLRDADIIERWAAKKTDSEYRSMLLEKKVFLSAFVIRKLIEDYKVYGQNRGMLHPLPSVSSSRNRGEHYELARH